MKLIVGLGNPGEKYEQTRHNLGFVVVEKFLKDFESAQNAVWTTEDKLKSEISHIEWQPKKGSFEKIILAKPKTFMNNSGMAVSLLANFYKIEPADIWIMHDEIDLPLGSMKIRFGGAAAGHHGVESVIERLGTDKFWRFRLGIGVSHHHDELGNKKMHNVDEFVVSNFTATDAGKARELIKRGSKALREALEHGLEAAMNQYNTK